MTLKYSGENTQIKELWKKCAPPLLRKKDTEECGPLRLRT